MECIVIFIACMRGVYVLIKHSSFVRYSRGGYENLPLRVFQSWVSPESNSYVLAFTGKLSVVPHLYGSQLHIQREPCVRR